MITSPAKRRAVIYSSAPLCGVRSREVDRDVAARRLRRMRLLGIVERGSRYTNGTRSYTMRGSHSTWQVTA